MSKFICLHFHVFGLFCKMMIFLIWEVLFINQFLQHVYYHVYNHFSKFYIFLNLFDIFKQGFKIKKLTFKPVFHMSVCGRPPRSTAPLIFPTEPSVTFAVDRHGRPSARKFPQSTATVDRQSFWNFLSLKSGSRSTARFSRSTVVHSNGHFVQNLISDSVGFLVISVGLLTEVLRSYKYPIDLSSHGNPRSF